MIIRKLMKEVVKTVVRLIEEEGMLVVPEALLPPVDIRLTNKKDIQCNGLRFNTFEGRFDINPELLRLICNKCDTDNNHMLHVAEFANVLCEQMNFSDEQTYEITNAALLHDIGKLMVASAVLFKIEKLTDEEFGVIHMHNKFGYNLLKKTDEPALSGYAAQIALEHHERIDGKGYIGLKGEEIDIGARIIAVADVFDALVSPRCYKKTWTFEQGFDYIIENSGIFFDVGVVKAFAEAKSEFRRIYDIYTVNV